MSANTGICRNAKELCSLASVEAVQEVQTGGEFKCTECRFPLVPVANRGGIPKPLLMALAAVVVVGGGAYGGSKLFASLNPSDAVADSTASAVDSTTERPGTPGAADRGAPAREPEMGVTPARSSSVSSGDPRTDNANVTVIPTPVPAPEGSGKSAPVPAPVTPVTEPPIVRPPDKPGTGSSTKGETTVEAAPATATFPAKTVLSAAVPDIACEIGNVRFEQGTRFALGLTQDVAGAGSAKLRTGDALFMRVTRRLKRSGQPNVYTVVADSIILNGTPFAIATDPQTVTATSISTGPSKTALGITGAVVGAAVGYAIKKNARGAIIGGAVGGVSGTVAGAVLSGTESCVAKGTTVQFTLLEPLSLPAGVR